MMKEESFEANVTSHIETTYLVATELEGFYALVVFQAKRSKNIEI